MNAISQRVPYTPFVIAGMPLRGILRFLRVGGALDGSVPGGRVNIVVVMYWL
jgi:hypothetical protein